MLTLTGRSQAGPTEVWRARAAVAAEPAEVLAALTDPELIAAWAPVGFALEEPGAGTLRSGSRERVSGSIAGLRASFDVHVACAELDRLELSAEGPLAMDVAYRFRARPGGVLLDASIGLRRGRGVTAQVLRCAVVALLNAGALERALGRLAAALEESAERELVAA